MDTVIEIVLGAIISIVITIWIESARKPELIVKVGPHDDVKYSTQHPAQSARYLRVVVENKPLPRLLRWMSRNAASQCHCSIGFFHLDGQSVFSSYMSGRWTGSPEPTPILSINAESVTIANVSFSSIGDASSTRRDIYPNEREVLDIVARFDHEKECYGWNDETYTSKPPWRNPKWQLQQGRYVIKVTVTSAGDKITRLFRLCNDVSVNDFRLEPALNEDYSKVKG